MRWTLVLRNRMCGGVCVCAGLSGVGVCAIARERARTEGARDCCRVKRLSLRGRCTQRRRRVYTGAVTVRGCE